jgi:hypothetical protein
MVMVANAKVAKVFRFNPRTQNTVESEGRQMEWNRFEKTTGKIKIQKIFHEIPELTKSSYVYPDKW